MSVPDPIRTMKRGNIPGKYGISGKKNYLSVEKAYTGYGPSDTAMNNARFDTYNRRANQLLQQRTDGFRDRDYIAFNFLSNSVPVNRDPGPLRVARFGANQHDVNKRRTDSDATEERRNIEEQRRVINESAAREFIERRESQPPPPMKSGGIVPKDGVYRLHKGEKVVPANKVKAKSKPKKK